MKVLVDNDATKGMALPAVIIANVRSGGTFLSHYLSNHPDIFCDRGESLHHLSIWHTCLTADRVKLLHCLTHQAGWRVSMCKLVYGQAFQPEVWAYLVRTQPHVIHLTRRNVIRQAVSALINRSVRSGQHAAIHPAHTVEDVPGIQIELTPDSILQLARGLVIQDQQAAKSLAGFPNVHPLDYASLGGEGTTVARMPIATGRAICSFLGVPYHAMSCDLKRVNPQPLSEILVNWMDVLPAIQASEFAEFLKDEPKPARKGAPR
jgi:hypothetical protein